MNLSRQEFRQQIRQLRQQLSPQFQQQASSQLAKQFSNLPEITQAEHIALYLSADGEIDTTL